MCRVEGFRLLGGLSPEQERRRECLRRGRRVVRKYRRISLRREMRRLRQLLPMRSSSKRRLSRAEVLEEAVDVIQRLEEQLAERLKEGCTPARLSNHLPVGGKIDLESIRKAVGDMMEARAVKR